MNDGAMALDPSGDGSSRETAARETAPREMAPAARAGHVRFQRLRVLFALVMREMSTTYGRSWGGYFWAIAEPLGGILLLSIAFGLALRTPPLGQSFMLFYATGYIPYNTYRAVASDVSGAVRSNRGLLSYPVVTAIDAVLSKFLLSTLTMFVVGVVLYAMVFLAIGMPVGIDFGRVALGFFLAALIGLGVGAVNCVLFGFFPTWRSFWKILSRPLFIASGVLFLFESAPAALQEVLWFNPVAHAIGMMREGIFGGYHPYFVSGPYVIAFSLSLFVIGAYLLRRHISALLDR